MAGYDYVLREAERKMKELLVSIITPTYNHEQFIGQCIESVLAQTFSDWEQVIVDDGSTDGTEKVIQGYRDPRIKYVRQEHKGPEHLAETYNLALAQSQAPLVAILEGDDFWPPDKLALQTPIFNDPNVVMSYGRWQLAAPDGHIVGQSHHFDVKKLIPCTLNGPDLPFILSMLRRLSGPMACTVMIRRRTLESIGGFIQCPGAPLVDFPTFLSVALKGKVKGVDSVLGIWRRTASSVTSTHVDIIYRAFQEYVERFLMKYSETLGLTHDEIATMKLGWRIPLADAYMKKGRMLLLGKHFREARKAFRQGRSLHSPKIQQRLALMLGELAASLHIPSIESLYRLLGKETLDWQLEESPKGNG